MMKRNLSLFIYAISFLSAQLQWYNHPELEWRTIESEHFKVHYHQGTERSAREAIEVAELVYKPITDLYEFIPHSKTEIIIKDVDDYSNGGAYFFENMIEIWSKPLDYDLRGSHRWMQDVISHEFTHIVQIGKSMKYKRNLLGTYIQKLDYEDEKREDVLYGYPNQIISYPIMPGVVLPMWLAEGTAQYMTNKIHFDYWDSVRDMLLRDRVLNNKMYSFKQMGSFEKCGLGNELVYNMGYSLVEYIAYNYGESALKDITSSLSKPFNFSINRAVKESIGISGEVLYSNWKSGLIDHYNNQIQEINDLKNYTILESDGITNINPRWSPSEDKIAYLSDKEHDKYGKTDLFYYSFKDSAHTKIMAGVKSIPTWVSDSLIIYTKVSKPDKNGSKFYDLYQYDLITEEEDQVTEGLRLFSPVYDRKNNQIVALNTYDGSTNIVVGNLDFSEYKVLTSFDNGMQIFSITLMNEDYLIDAVKNHERNLYIVNSQTGKISDYMQSTYDIRDPEYLDNKLIYSDDKGGIYNLYYKDESKEGYITNVIGGAFKPDIAEDGRIVFSIFQDGGYKLAYLESFDIIGDTVGINSEKLNLRPESVLADKQFEGESIKYEEKMTGPFFVPKLMIDYGTVKPGLYFFDNEALRKLTVLGGIGYNSRKDLDFFLLFDYNKSKLTYYFNLYWMSRHTSRLHKYKNSGGEIIDNIVYDVDYIYHLFSADLGTRFMIKEHKFWMYYTYYSARQFYDYVITQKLPESYIEDFFFENESNIVRGDDAYDYFRNHSFTIKYEFDARKKHYLYNMVPNKGYKIDALLSYEMNKLFEKFKINKDVGSISPYLASHDTWKFTFNINKYSRIDLKNNKFISITNILNYNRLFNDNINDFVYFFGGGLPGLKGYTFYEPSLQGPEIYMISNEVRFPLITEQAIGFDMLNLSSLSVGIIHQFAKAQNAKIVSQWSYEPELKDDLMNWLDADDLDVIEFDALDKDNNIPDEFEDQIYVDVYNIEFDSSNAETMSELKKRYNKTKQSIGLEFRLLGFSFYSYPTALSYEYHIPLNESITKKGKQYLKILFEF